MTRFASATLMALVLLGGITSAGQTPPRPAPLGAIAGRLVDAEGGGPVRKAQVRLVSSVPRMTRTAATDADGRFAFQDLPATEYTLSASRAGFLDMVYGARRPLASSPGAPILLSPGQRISNVSFALPRAGVIAGTVRDEFGDPAFNVPVRAMRLSFASGERIPQAGATAVTDDLGAYRIAGLIPGEYLVAAVPRDTVMTAQSQFQDLTARAAAIVRGGFEDSQAAADRMRQAEAEGRAPKPPSATGYVPVYYPGTVQPSEAQHIQLAVGQQVNGADMRLEVVQTATVVGTVTSPDGQPSAARVQLLNPAAPTPTVGIWFRDAGPGGQFSFSGLVPGTYVVRARKDVAGGSTATGMLTGAAEAQVGPGGTSSVSLVLQPGVQVAGSLALAAITAPFDRTRVRVNLLPVPAAADPELASRTATPDATGRFVVRGVVTARYRVEVVGLPSGWHLASAVFDNRDAADRHLIVEPDGHYDGRLTFTSTTAEVSGGLASALGTQLPSLSVVLFPAESELRVPASRRIRVAQSSLAGRYTISTLPPGEYRLATVDDLEPGQQFGRAFLETLHARSVAVTLREGERKVQDIPVR